MKSIWLLILTVTTVIAWIPCSSPSTCPGDTRCWDCRRFPDTETDDQVCVPKESAIGMACNDGDPFTAYDRCLPSGHCAGIPLECSRCTTDIDCANPEILLRLVNAHNSVVIPIISLECTVAVCKTFMENQYVGPCCALKIQDGMACMQNMGVCNCSGVCEQTVYPDPVDPAI